MKKKSAVKITAAIGLVGISLVILLFYLAYTGKITLPFGLQEQVDLMPDIRAVDGSILVKDPDAKVKENDYRVVVDQKPVMQEGSRKCKLNLENAAGNHYAVRVRLKDYKGKEYYVSHRIDPGKRIETVQLSKSLRAGTHEMQLTYQLYDLKTRKARGSMSVNIRLVVKK